MGNTSSTHSNRSRSARRKPETPLLECVHKGFNPTRQDVQIAIQILMGLRLQSIPGHLPPELALSILAHADYCPRITSSRAGRADYHARGARPWYLTTPMLPPDFRRATSITLQVRSHDHQIDRAPLGAAYIPEDYDQRCTWFEMCILRPLRRSPPSPPSESGYVIHGCVVRKKPEFGVQVPPRPQRVTGDGDPDRWLVVKHNGRDTWVIYHHNSQVRSDVPSRELSRDWINGALNVPPRDFETETYRVVWPADRNTDVQDPAAFVDGEGFLSALMPGDKVAFWATAEGPASGIAVMEAVMEIVYDVSV